MSIDERLATTNFPLPTIRQVNMAKHANAISLGLGELKDFKVDPKIVDALCSAMHTNGANYTQNAGVPELRNIIAVEQSKVDNFKYTLDNVIITIGVQNAMYVTIKTLAKLGAKRVLIPEINFGIYKKIPIEFDLEVITYPLISDFGIDINALKNIINDDDIIIVNSPSNPTGRVLTDSEQQDIGNLLVDKLTKGYVISDEIYSKLVYDGSPSVSISKYFNRTIIVDGISKSAAAAGLRVGWVITQNKKLASAITSGNAVILSCPPTVNQYAAIPVVNNKTQNAINKYNNTLKTNRDIVAKELQKANIPFVLPKGSFYIFPKIEHLINVSVKEFCIKTAQKDNGVVVIPGEAFGAKEYVRISLASMQIKEGILRFIEAVDKK